MQEHLGDYVFSMMPESFKLPEVEDVIQDPMMSVTS